MSSLRRFGLRSRMVFTDKKRSQSADEAAGQNALVRLIDPPRSPATPIERRLVSVLEQAGSVPLASLIDTVAADLYSEALRRGGGVLDIGLIGSRLFNGDVIRELQAGDGVFWEIKKEREST